MSQSPQQDHEQTPQPADRQNSQPQDEDLSLEQLSRTYADLMDPDAEPPDDDAAQTPQETDQQAGPTTGDRADVVDAAAAADDDVCEISPRTILEAMLFVGTPDNEPFDSRRLASLMRGVQAAEIDSLVRELNASYAKDGSPYIIASEGAGYRMTVRREFGRLRDKFYGRIRQARLSQAAIDVLAIVAYNQPLTKQKLEELRGRSSGSLLSQLVRRRLLEIDRCGNQSRDAEYHTTERFLNLFGLGNLDDLPQSHELDSKL